MALTVVTPTLKTTLLSVVKALATELVTPLSVYLILVLLQLSVAVASHDVPVCLKVHEELLALTALFPVHVITGAVLSLTVIVLDTDASVLPQTSVAVHVSVTGPHPLVGIVEKADKFDVPLIKQPPLNPLLKLIVLAAGTAPQATVMSASAVIVGSAAGLTVIVLDTEPIVLKHASVAVHVSVTVPPHAPGVAVNVEVFEVPLIAHPPVNP